jgi:hypothetical protein
MHRFVGRDIEPISNEIRPALSAETPGGIERQIDGDEFDVRERMEQREPPAF